MVLHSLDKVSAPNSYWITDAVARFELDLSMRQLLCVLAILTLATPARAQFSQPPPDEPTPSANTPPAPPPPPAVAAGEASALIQRGKQKKVVGGTLIILGSFLSAGGSALIIADAIGRANCRDCGVGSLSITGIVFDLVGTACIAGGIPTYVIGGTQVDQGRRLQGPNLAFRF
jgi:hypothetical protein